MEGGTKGSFMYLCALAAVIPAEVMQTRITFEPLLTKLSWISSNTVPRYVMMYYNCMYM